MSLSITERCVNCYACMDVCPQEAISLLPKIEGKRSQFEIDSKSCTECVGDYAEPQCASICPVEGALLDSMGKAIHPDGSLTGIPPQAQHKLQAVPASGLEANG